MDADALNGLAKRTLDAALAIHTELGPGPLESSYRACLKAELEQRGLRVQAEVPLPVIYKGEQLVAVGYRIDLLVCGELVLEVKAVEAIAPVHLAQLLSYLKHSKKRWGFC